MRVTILTQYYPPEIGAPQARLSEFAAALVRRGHEVTVLTAMPSYPVGRIHPGYGGVLRRESRDGVRIIRTLIFPTQRADLLGRLANYSTVKCASVVRPVRPLMGRMSCGQAENATTRSISARKTV